MYEEDELPIEIPPNINDIINVKGMYIIHCELMNLSYDETIKIMIENDIVDKNDCLDYSNCNYKNYKNILFDDIFSMIVETRLKTIYDLLKLEELGPKQDTEDDDGIVDVGKHANV